MPTVIRPRRSVLFMPGSNARALERAKTLPADGLIFDLEDAVAPDAKETARQMVCHAVRAGGYGRRELIVRVNALAALWGDADLAAVATCGVDAVLLPKVESSDMVRQVLSILTTHGAPEQMAIWCMLETPRGILRAEDIAASPRVTAFVMGTSDLTKELHARHTHERFPILPSLGWCVLVGRAYGLTVLDGVHLDLNDDEGFEDVCRQAADMGFDGKTLIHPKTIATANRIFAPSPDNLASARKIIAAHAEATAQGKGVAAGAGGMAVGGDVAGNVFVSSTVTITSGRYTGPSTNDPSEAVAIYRRMLVDGCRHMSLWGLDVDASDPTGSQKHFD